MYVLRNIVARSRNHIHHERAKIFSPCFVELRMSLSTVQNAESVYNGVSRIISSINFNAQFSLFINNVFTLLSSTCFEH